MKNLILKFINKPTPNILSSQTLYECVFYLLNIDANKKDVREVIQLIIETQLPDGGFDIGYNFSFGPDLWKSSEKEGTSPELLSLTALGMYTRKFGLEEPIETAIKKALSWIDSRYLDFGDTAAIPYAPDSFPYIHITNATSFCISALASVFDLFGDDIRIDLQRRIQKMCLFMEKQLVSSSCGKFWPYFYQNSSEFESKFINSKIDNYHIAQQLYHHCLTSDFIKIPANENIIESVSEYLLSQFDSNGFIPYTKFNDRLSNKVHLWGYSSLIPALSVMYRRTGNIEFKDRADQVLAIIKNKAYSGDYFAPILISPGFEKFDSNFYPRSDAWVIHALSEIVCESDTETESVLSMSRPVYERIKNSGFRGLENHVTTFRMKIFAKIVRVFLH